MKKTMVIIAVLLWSAAIVQIGINKSSSEAITAFSKNTIDNQQGVIKVQTELINYYSDIQRKELLEDIASGFGIKTGYDYTSEYAKGRGESILTKKNSNSNITISIISLENEEQENIVNIKQYLTVSIIINNYMEDILKYRQITEEIMREKGFETVVKANIEGSIKGDIDSNESKKFIKDLCDELSINKITEYDEKNMYIEYGYSKEIDDYIVDNNKRINVYMELNYNKNKDRTTIYISMPEI